MSNRWDFEALRNKKEKEDPGTGDTGTKKKPKVEGIDRGGSPKT